MQQIHRHGNWRRVASLLRLREVVVLVAGILIAFALDAWWQRRGDARHERAHLRALASDFDRNIERLNELIALETRTADSSRRLLALGPEAVGAHPDSLVSLLGPIYTSNRFEPVLGTYRALESSGGLAQLRDDSLRRALAEFAAQLNVRYYERFSDEIYFALIREFAGEIPFFARYVADDRTSFSGAPRLLSSPRFREYIALRHLATRDVASEYRRLARQAEIIRDRLRRLED
jgi:hypothetical protein